LEDLGSTGNYFKEGKEKKEGRKRGGPYSLIPKTKKTGKDGKRLALRIILPCREERRGKKRRGRKEKVGHRSLKEANGKKKRRKKKKVEGALIVQLCFPGLKGKEKGKKEKLKSVAHKVKKEKKREGVAT